MTSTPMFDEFRKAQEILTEAVDNTLRGGCPGIRRVYAGKDLAQRRVQGASFPLQ